MQACIYGSQAEATEHFALQLGYAKDAIVGVCHRTSKGQEHRFIQHAGLQLETFLHLCAWERI